MATFLFLRCLLRHWSVASLMMVRTSSVGETWSPGTTGISLLRVSKTWTWYALVTALLSLLSLLSYSKKASNTVSLTSASGIVLPPGLSAWQLMLLP